MTPISRKYFIDFLCNLQVQMQTIQLKLENIRSIFENHRLFRMTDKHVRPIPFVVPASDNLVRSRAPFFSPGHKVEYLRFLSLFSSAVVYFVTFNVMTTYFSILRNRNCFFKHP